MKVVILQGNNSSPYPTSCRDFVAGLQFAQLGLLFFLATLLRQDHDDIKKANKNDWDKQRAPERTRAATRLQQH